jgi:hypothetical protein
LAAFVVGFVQIEKSCGMVPLFVYLKVTVPCGTVFVESTNLNSDGLPAVTVTVVAARTGRAWPRSLRRG